MKGYQKIDSYTLMRDGLKHIMHELSQQKPNLFRIGKEAYRVLCLSMTEALLGGNPDNVTYKMTPKRDKHRTRFYRYGQDPWSIITKQKIEGCISVWRYSQPEECEEPTFDDTDTKQNPSERKLLPFDDMLAMIQTVCCMGRYFHSKPIYISDREMQILDWLHRQVRNEFEHFTPKGYWVCKDSLINSSALALRTAREILHESGTVIPLRPRPAKRLLDGLVKKIQQQELK